MDPISVPTYLVVAPWACLVSITSLILTGFFRGSLMSRRNHDEQSAQLKESRDEWRSTAKDSQAQNDLLIRRSVVLPAEHFADAIIATPVKSDPGGGD